MKREKILAQIARGFVASCQPVDKGPMDRPEIIAAMAKASEIGGAVAVRIQGVENVRMARSQLSIPIIGIVKRDLEHSPIRITPFVQDIEALIDAGADVIAIDGTDRVRPVPLDQALAAVKKAGVLAMADCSTLSEGLYCQTLGFDIIGSTMSGYTGGEIPQEPDLQLVRDLKEHGCFVMAEGRYNNPQLCQEAIRAGADSVTVGSVLTRLELMVKTYVEAVDVAKQLHK